jgi:hypothetical protein
MRASEFILEGDMLSALQKVASIIKMEAGKPNPQQFVLDKLMRLMNNHDDKKVLSIINQACQQFLHFPTVSAYADSLK